MFLLQVTPRSEKFYGVYRCKAGNGYRKDAYEIMLKEPKNSSTTGN